MTRATLGDIRVLDLSEDVAGPYATKLLAGLGAEVIKVERTSVGEVSRRRGPFLGDQPHLETSAAFLFLNPGKKSVELQLETNAGREALFGLLEKTDILVESYGPGGLEARDLAPELLRRRFPQLILLRISDFGQDGPYSAFAGEEIVLQALGGLLFLTGDPDKPPLRLGGGHAYYLAGLNAFVALTGALLGRDRHGLGACIDLSVCECVVGVLETATHRYAARGEVATRDGNWANRAAWGIYPCADGHVAIVSGDGLMFRRMGTLIPELQGTRFDSYEERRLHADEINAHLLAWLAGRTKHDAAAAGQAQRLPFGAVNRIDDLLREPQLRARGFFEQIGHPVTGVQTYPRAPFRLLESPWVSGPAPLLGEHNEEVSGYRGQGTEGRDEGGHAGLPLPRRLVGADLRARPEPATFPHPGPLPEEDGARSPSLRGKGPGVRSASPLSPESAALSPLRGVRVLDLTMVWAGPFAAMLLADAGAEVLKIESLRHVDSRLWAGIAYRDADPANPPYARDGYVILFSRNKLGLTLDLASDVGRALFLRLVAVSDVVIENFAAGVMERLGLDFETLRVANPRIVMARMPAFGASGPASNSIAYGTTLEALSGLASITGYGANEPHKSGINSGDPVAGLHSAGAVQAALHRVRRDGCGELIEVAQLESLSMLLGESILDYSMNGHNRQPMGNADVASTPHGVYPCAGEDRWIAIAIAADEEWQWLVRLLGNPPWALAPALRTAGGRRANADAIDSKLAAWTRTQEQIELMQRLQVAGVRAGAVLDVAQILRDPHLAARGLFCWMEHPDGVNYPLTLNPWRRDGVREAVRRVAPALGEHNDHILGEMLGLTRDEVAQLEKEHVIGRLPRLADPEQAKV